MLLVIFKVLLVLFTRYLVLFTEKGHDGSLMDRRRWF